MYEFAWAGLITLSPSFVSLSSALLNRSIKSSVPVIAPDMYTLILFHLSVNCFTFVCQCGFTFFLCKENYHPYQTEVSSKLTSITQTKQRYIDTFQLLRLSKQICRTKPTADNSNAARIYVLFSFSFNHRSSHILSTPAPSTVF